MLPLIFLLTSTWSRSEVPQEFPLISPAADKRETFGENSSKESDSKVKQLIHINLHKPDTKSAILLELEQIKLKAANEAERPHKLKQDDRTLLRNPKSPRLSLSLIFGLYTEIITPSSAACEIQKLFTPEPYNLLSVNPETPGTPGTYNEHILVSDGFSKGGQLPQKPVISLPRPCLGGKNRLYFCKRRIFAHSSQWGQL